MVRVQCDNFSIQTEIDALTLGRSDIGALVSFIGLVRDFHAGEQLSSMTLEHYPCMTESALTEIEIKARERWQLTGVSIIHRIGKLFPAEQIVLVITASAHRQAAFDSANFIMDYLKTLAPFWKKETLMNGKNHWVDARNSDTLALTKWDQYHEHS